MIFLDFRTETIEVDGKRQLARGLGPIKLALERVLDDIEGGQVPIYARK